MTQGRRRIHTALQILYSELTRSTIFPKRNRGGVITIQRVLILKSLTKLVNSYTLNCETMHILLEMAH